VANFTVAEFRMVAHVPVLSRSDQPTFAIISLLYCEKLAVDAMIDYKTTYIRCKKGRILHTSLPQIRHQQAQHTFTNFERLMRHKPNRSSLML